MSTQDSKPPAQTSNPSELKIPIFRISYIHYSGGEKTHFELYYLYRGGAIVKPREAEAANRFYRVPQQQLSLVASLFLLAWRCWMLLINRTGRGVSQKERPPKVTTTKIRIVIRSFDHPFFENHFGGLQPYTRKIGLPESRVLYTVLRSPHIDKKSREQFEMEIKKKFLIIKTEKHELRKKLFRLKRRATRRT